jgi:hypothetical protein
MSICPRCGAAFSCGMTDDKAAQPCWCTRLPVLPESALAAANGGKAAACFCPDCLQALIAAEKTPPHAAG